MFVKRFDAITNVLRADIYLATTVKCFRALVYPRVGVDPSKKSVERYQPTASQVDVV